MTTTLRRIRLSPCFEPYAKARFALPSGVAISKLWVLKMLIYGVATKLFRTFPPCWKAQPGPLRKARPRGFARFRAANHHLIQSPPRSTLIPDDTNSASKKTELEKVAELLKVEFLPPLDPGDAQSLHKALPGYQAVADDTARLVKKHGKTLNLDAAVLADLEQGLADVNRLEPPERLLEKLRLSVYHQRLQATSQCRQGPCTIPPAASGTFPRPTPPMGNQRCRGSEIPARLHEGLQTGQEKGEKGTGWRGATVVSLSPRDVDIKPLFSKRESCLTV
uniref:Uncharacterized protein n=1 Tax=Candidatus Kentrum sp. FW TaxID=2126338 RepID=A0A450RXJ7_9GAMM|nr:MAG: hypothetical protein BECKFW1821A_GA0114235_100546 [Candidatus Kentron sp. FW]